MAGPPIFRLTGVSIVRGAPQLRKLGGALRDLERAANKGTANAAGNAAFAGTVSRNVNAGIAFAVGMAAAGVVTTAAGRLGPLGRGLAGAWAYLEVAPAVEFVTRLELDGGQSLLG